MKRGYIEQRGEHKFLVRWRVKDSLTGKRRQLSKVVEGDYGRALAFLAEQLDPKKANQIERVDRTFGSYLDTEWALYVRDNWKESTQTTQGSFVKKHIRPYFEMLLLTQIRPSTIVAFHQAMEDKKLSRTTRRNLHAILTRMFSYAVELELIDKTPIKKGSAPRLEKAEKPALTEGQLQQLFSVVPIRYKAFYMTLALTGIRTGEALGLKWQDINFAGSQLHIRRQIYRGKETSPKTAISIRPRPMVPKLRATLLSHKAMSVYDKPGDYVFASSSGRPLNPDQLRDGLQKALKQLGIQFAQPRADGMHLLRHSSGSVVYRQTGGDLKATQEWLGHSSSRITADTYIHLAKDQQQKTAETLQRAIFARPDPVAAEQMN